MLLNILNALKTFSIKLRFADEEIRDGRLAVNARTSSHQPLAAALSGVVMNFPSGPDQYGAWRRRASMTFRALIQDSLSLMGLMPKSEGLSLMVTSGVAGVAVAIGAGVVSEELDEAGWREPAMEETTNRLPNGMNPHVRG